MFFEDCRTQEDIKKAYRRECIRLHPDNGGSEELFKQMQQDFKRMFDKVKNVHVNKDGEFYEKSGEYATSETAEEFMDIIDSLNNLPELEVEICGTWLWISGNTKPVKEKLSALGCKWSQNKRMWYYQRDGLKRFHKRAWTIDQIRGVYGSQKVRNGVKMAIESEA